MQPQPVPVAPGTTPGAACHRHPQAPAAAACARCGSFACAICLPAGAQGLCPACVSHRPEDASAGRRVLGWAVDAGVGGLAASAVAILELIEAFERVAQVAPDAKAAVLSESLGGARATWLGFAFAAPCAYALLEAATGRTVGKWLVRRRVVDAGSGRALGVRVLVLRNAVPTVLRLATLGVFAVVDALVLLRPGARSVHDRMAGTRVVRTR